jgi:HK97 family phage major capsid protein
MEFEKQLESLQSDLKSYVGKLEQERKEFGDVTKETKGLIEEVNKRVDQIDMKLVTLPSRNEVKTLGMCLKENDSVQRVMKEGGRGVVNLTGDAAAEVLGYKSTITSSTVGFPTAGVMPEERGRYVQEARRPLRMRDVIPSRSTALQQISWPKASVTGTKASPVAEAGAKPLNTYDPTMVTERVKTLATYFDAGRQVLEDWTELEGIIRSLGTYKVNQEEDTQILFGSNAGENYNGLTTQAQAWSLAYLNPGDGYKYFDILAGAINQIADDDEVAPTFAVVHPTDWWRMRRQKDTTGQYILGNPQEDVAPSLWGLNVIPTTQMTSGYFAVGNGTAQCAEIRDRMGVEVMISTEHASNFTSNLVTIRIERRSCLCVYRPNAFVYGAFTQSPA